LESFGSPILAYDTPTYKVHMSENLSKLIQVAKELGRDHKELATLAELAENELKVLLCAAKLPMAPSVDGHATFDVKATMLRGLSDICLLTSKAAAGINKPLLEARALSVELYLIANAMQCRENLPGHPSFPEVTSKVNTDSHPT
jgi:hypothetical protein